MEHVYKIRQLGRMGAVQSLRWSILTSQTKIGLRFPCLELYCVVDLNPYQLSCPASGSPVGRTLTYRAECRGLNPT